MNPEHLVVGKQYRHKIISRIFEYKRAEQLVDKLYLYYFTCVNFRGEKIIKKFTTLEVTKYIEPVNKIHLAMECVNES